MPELSQITRTDASTFPCIQPNLNCSCPNQKPQEHFVVENESSPRCLICQGPVAARIRTRCNWRTNIDRHCSASSAHLVHIERQVRLVHLFAYSFDICLTFFAKLAHESAASLIIEARLASWTPRSQPEAFRPPSTQPLADDSRGSDTQRQGSTRLLDDFVCASGDFSGE